MEVPDLYDPPLPANIALVLKGVHDWYTVGMKLDLGIAELDDIKKDPKKTADDKKTAMGRLWLDMMKERGDKPTWKFLLDIVTDMAVTRSIAQIKEHYKPGVERPEPEEEYPVISIHSVPKMKHLHRIPNLKAPLKVIEDIASEWIKVARELDVPEGVIKQIEKQKAGRLEDQCVDMLQRWLDGGYKKPVTWDTLVKVLFNVDYDNLARKLIRYMCLY